MVVSTKGRYALRVMLDLAAHQSEGFIPLKSIAARQDISEKYLESILKTLVREGLLVGLRGKGGGYQLTKSADAYTVDEILRLTEGDLAPVACLASQPTPCERKASCKTYPMWRALDEMIHNFFRGITLADLLQNGSPGDQYMI